MTQHHDTRISIRNPFGTMDVPAPHDGDVVAFAAAAALSGDAEDVNAAPWASEPRATDPLEGVWASRWNGGADPTIPGDARRSGSRAGPNSASTTTDSICASTGTVAAATA